MRDSYFMRVTYWDWDVEGIAPIYIKIPISCLSPSPNMLMLLMALEEFYGVDCYLAIEEIMEIPDGRIGFVPFGIITEEVMLITAPLEDSRKEFLCGITSASGEYTLLALDEDGKSFEGLIATQELANYLQLEYIPDATRLHKDYLESIGCYDEPEYVYFPSALYSL